MVAIAKVVSRLGSNVCVLFRSLESLWRISLLFGEGICPRELFFDLGVFRFFLFFRSHFVHVVLLCGRDRWLHER